MSAQNPPIVELALGIQFVSERPVDIAKIILFWNESLRTEYPDVSEAVPIPDTFEKFGEDIPQKQPAWEFPLKLDPRIRFQFTNSVRDRMVQLQPSRLVLNWMRRDSEYPRFSKIHAEFIGQFESWKTFSAGNRVGEIIPNQWELIYVNFIPQGELWETPADWHRISSLFVSAVDSFEPLAFEDRQFQWQLSMPDRTGRITLSALRAKNAEGGTGMQLMIVARGPARTLDEAHSRLRAAHDYIIQVFSRLIADEAKRHWGIEIP